MDILMTFVVTDNCNLCRFTDCVTVCPVDCFYGDESQLYINPDECIDCGACESECPVNAIFSQSSIPANKQQWININIEKSASCSQITEKQLPHPNANAEKKKLGF